MAIYQDKDHALRAEKVAAKARRIVNLPQVTEKLGRETILLKQCTLRESAFCVIEKPLRKSKKSG